MNSMMLRRWSEAWSRSIRPPNAKITLNGEKRNKKKEQMVMIEWGTETKLIGKILS